MDKVCSMAEAIAEFVKDGDTVYLAGFTHLIPFAAGHEIIRQGRRHLTLCRATPDLIYDQMIAAGCADKLVFGWAGNPGVSPLKSFRRAVEQGIPHRIELEEYSHFGIVAALNAAAMNLPFMPLRSLHGTDIERVNPRIKQIASPYDPEDRVSLVPPLHLDVAIIHVQRADREGNGQIWGIIGEQKEAAFAAKHVILSTEELVDTDVIRRDPNRTVIPGFIVSAVVHEPWGAHPSYAQGYYDRDREFYLEWSEISSTHERTLEYLERWVYGVKDRREYMELLGEETRQRLAVKPMYSSAVNYGAY